MRSDFGTRLGRRVLAVCAAALVLCSGALWGGGEGASGRPAGLPPEKTAEIRRLVRDEMAAAHIPGLSIAVGDDYQVVWSEGFGIADLENSVPATSETVYRLASISKPITAVAVMQLAERGLIDINAPIQKYVPSFPEKQWPVTVRHLLEHTSGIRHYRSLDEIDSTRHYTNSVDPIKTFAADPLLFEPGTRFSYTTYGFCLLGAAVEKVAGVPLEEYFKQHIFEPAGMKAARADNVYELIPHRARGYKLGAHRQVQNCDLADTSNKIAGGGLVATAGDLVRFACAFDRGKLVKPASVQQMLAPAKLPGGTSPYGLGWYVRTRGGRTWFSHSGGQQGVSTYLLAAHKQGISVAIMANMEQVNLRPLANRIAELVLEPAGLTAY